MDSKTELRQKHYMLSKTYENTKGKNNYLKFIPF